MKTLIVCHYTLERTKPSALQGLNALRKFSLIKLLFLFFVINRFIEVIIDPHSFFCQELSSITNLEKFVCEVRFGFWLGIVEIAVLSIPLLLFFRANDFEGNHTMASHDLPKRKRQRLPLLLFCTLNILNLFSSFIYPPLSSRGRLAHIAMETNDVLQDTKVSCPTITTVTEA